MYLMSPPFAPILTSRLDQSRAHRIVWLLELLELEYSVEVAVRDPDTWRGPKDAFRAHPLGKYPILEITFADGLPKLKLAESGFIIQYLVEHHDPKGILKPKTALEKAKVDYYLHYAEGTLQPILVSLLINAVAKKVAPVGLKSLAKIVTRGINNGYYYHEWKLNMEYLENRLKKEGTGFFVGDKLSAADVIMSFPIYENIFDNEGGIREITGDKRDLQTSFPHLARWSQMLRDDPLYSRITSDMDQRVDEYSHGRRSDVY